ncbi:MAG TPA: hypothetical protein VGY54_20685 [Polyangiaceae bacterium]|nr:hypothetical protein [Polyangiaceae bacterium]
MRVSLVMGIGVLAACAARPPPSASSSTSPGASCSRLSPAACVGAPPTHALDVRPILERRCFACHANDGPAAESHDFSRLETVRAQRSAIADEVASCSMPPPRAPPLTESEAATLLRWVACGAPAH